MPTSEPAEEQEAPATLGPRVAVALVFGSSAAVLVVEIVALRLLAPYFGLTLETSTLVIGIALAAIALGSWAGGWVADRVAPRRLLGPLLGVSGVAVALTPFTVRAAGASGDATLLLVAASASILVPGALLSAVTPVVIKLRLTNLGETGAVVGRLSGIGTLGAIAGTVVTGFVLISRVPVSGILAALGVLLVASAVVAQLRLRGGGGSRGLVALVAVGTLGALSAAAAPGGCDVETTYHCLTLTEDPERPGGRLLVLDGVRHSYVDLDDPTHLDFPYVRALAAAVDATHPGDAALRVHHLGGGGLTYPRYLALSRPGTRSVVSEIDRGVARVDRERLGLDDAPGVTVRVEDARLGLGRLAEASQDVVVGDAFSGMSVPWHLTTREALAEIRRVLTAEGVYALNLIDRGPLAFARAEVATVRSMFGEVALLAPPEVVGGGVGGRDGGGNLVVVATDRDLDADALRAAVAERDLDWEVLYGTALTAWIGDAPLLDDDFAPVDQLFTPPGFG